MTSFFRQQLIGQLIGCYGNQKFRENSRLSLDITTFNDRLEELNQYLNCFQTAERQQVPKISKL